ncbi:MAG: class I SAM-dependent methyltransferase [Nitrospirota bacterium]
MVNLCNLKEEIVHGEKISHHAEFIWGQETKAGQLRVDRRSRILTSSGELNPSKKILELGCGTGEYTLRLAKTGSKIIAIDISLPLINQAKQKIKATNVNFVIADAENLPFKDNTFDAVVGNAVLHHLDLDSALEEMKRVLKTGGKIAFTEPNMLNPQNLVVKNIKIVKRWVGESPDERAFFKWQICRLLRHKGFSGVVIRPFDFLHPVTPRVLVPWVNKLGMMMERIPIINEIAGSLMIKGVK